MMLHDQIDNEQNPSVFTQLELVEDGYKNVLRDHTKDMKKYKPLFFEDCFVRGTGKTRFVSKLELLKDSDLRVKTDPSHGVTNYKGFHLFVLCHGFHGNSFDVRSFKNAIHVAMPDALILCSEANEANSDQDLDILGRKLADEMLKFISDNCPGSSLGRLSFIGHSLGGLIIRAAFAHLTALFPKFHGFLSLCSPHLGCVYTSNKLLTTGMWFMKTVKKSKVIH